MTVSRRKTCHGFTIIEMLIVAGIIVVMSATAMAYLGGARTSRDVDAEAHKMTSVLREVQNDALTGRAIGGGTACNNASGVAFTISVTEGSATVTVTYNKRDTTTNACTVTASTTYAVTGGVTFAAARSFSFSLPNGRVYDSGGTELSGASNIQFTLQKDAVTDNVCVYPFGRIEQKAIGVDC
jgi:prepilin-type N-terminal cleavage/methylation domain-containing protein